MIVHLENCAEQLFAWFGCAWIGAVAVTTNARSSGAEISYFADVARARAAITQPKFAELIAGAFPQAEWIAVTDSDAGDMPARAPSAQDRFSALMRDAAEAPPARGIAQRRLLFNSLRARPLGPRACCGHTPTRSGAGVSAQRTKICAAMTFTWCICRSSTPMPRFIR